MRKQLVLSVVLGAVLLLSAATTVSAQCCDAGQFTPQHEVRLSAGCMPITYGSWTKYDIIYNPLVRTGAVYTSGVWSLSYGYRFTKWFDLGVLVSHYGEYSALYSNLDNSKIHPKNTHNISILPVARFTWLNRPLVRLYSSLSLGVLIEVDRQAVTSTDAYVGGQLVFAGISVGKSLFGFAEIGAGTQGLATVGIGYRFNAKRETK